MPTQSFASWLDRPITVVVDYKTGAVGREEYGQVLSEARHLKKQPGRQPAGE